MSPEVPLNRTAGQASELRRGVVAMIPLWAGVAPFAVAFALLARTAGLSVIETQLLSLTVFAGGAQVALVTLLAAGANGIAIVLTVLALNLRHVLYGLSLSTQFGPDIKLPIPLLAYVLTDEAYGVTIRDGLDGRGGPSFYFGAGLSLYGVFNLTTLAGSLVGQLLPNSERLGLSFIFPLTFLALLMPLLRHWRQCLVAATAAISALLLGRVVAGGLTILLAALIAAGLGVALETLGARKEETA
ncbi:MAG TPA: AzlC family ABC transporter permease [Thermomicrobiales bacterium]|jgi:4-azaleucine resistance transporter AzlC